LYLGHLQFAACSDDSGKDKTPAVELETVEYRAHTAFIDQSHSCKSIGLIIGNLVTIATNQLRLLIAAQNSLTLFQTHTATELTFSKLAIASASRIQYGYRGISYRRKQFF